MSTKVAFLGIYSKLPPKPKYIDGRLYISEDGKTVLMYAEKAGNSNHPGFHRLNKDGKEYLGLVGHGSVPYYEEEYGKLTEIKASTYGASDKLVQASFV